MTGRYRLRGAHLLARRGVAVVAVLLLVAVAAGGVAGYDYTHRDEVTTVTERTDVRTVGLVVNHSAVVTGSTPMWSTGTRLTDRPVYLREPTPTLALTSQVSTPSGVEVRLEHRVAVVVTATVDGATLWTDRWTLGSRTTAVSDGGLLARTTLDVPSLADRLAGLRESVSAPVSFSLALEVRTRYDTGRYAGTLSTSAPLSVGERTYSVGTFPTAERTHSRRVTRRVRRSEPLPTRTRLAGGVAVLALVGAVGAALARRRVDDPERLRRRLERARFDEWISTGHVPGDPGETTVSVSSLADLVDVAIDSNRRVIHDEHRGVYAVLDGETTYEYRESDGGG
ncbi:MAG: DUF5305 family protein [Haloferacaceae archaeon]